MSKADRLEKDPSNSQEAEKIAKNVRWISRGVTDLYLSARRFTEDVHRKWKSELGYRADAAVSSDTYTRSHEYIIFLIHFNALLP